MTSDTQRVPACLSQTDLFPRPKSYMHPPTETRQDETGVVLPHHTSPSAYSTPKQSWQVRPAPPPTPSTPHAPACKASIIVGSCKEVAGPHHSGTATSAWGLKTMRHSPLGDCCNCEGAWSRTYSISSATVGEGEERAQSGSLQRAPWGCLLDPGIPAHAFI